MKNIVLKPLIVLILLFHGPLAQTSLSSETQSKINENVFIVVPINAYASGMSAERVDAYLSQNCQGEKPSPRLQLNCEHLQTCVGEEECGLIFGTHGTAFLVESGTRLVTAWHVLFQTNATALEFLARPLEKKTLEERRELALRRLTPHFVLMNQEREIVYDTRNVPAKYEMIGDPIVPVFHKKGKKGEGFFGYHEGIPTDWVVTELGESLGEGLKMAPQQNTLGDEFFIAGFGFDRYEMNFSVNAGEASTVYSLNNELGIFTNFSIRNEEKSFSELMAMSISEVLSYMGYSEESIAQQIEDYPEETLLRSIEIVLGQQQRHQRDWWVESHKEEVFFSTIPSLPGHSGGPFLNKSGEVLGLVSTGFFTAVEEEGPLASVGSGTLLFERSEILNYLQ